MTHICVCKLTIIGSDNGLSPGRHLAIIWTNVGILLMGHAGTNYSEISIKIHIFSFMKMQLKMSSGNWQPTCLGLNVLIKFPFYFWYYDTMLWKCFPHYWPILEEKPGGSHQRNFFQKGSVMKSIGIFFLKMLFNKQLSCKRFEMP